MANSRYTRASLARAALETAPPLIRKTLIEDAAFRAEYGFGMEAVISFADFGISFQRSELFRAVRSILARRRELKISDTDGHEWRLTRSDAKGQSPRLTIVNGQQQLTLPDFSVLSRYKTTRLRSFDMAAADVGLPAEERQHWRQMLADRALEDDEVAGYHNDFRNTPTHVARSIRAEIDRGSTAVSSLVPSSRKYYERLVGAYDGSASIRAYAACGGRAFFSALAKRDRRGGFLSALLLSSHSALTTEINVNGLDDAKSVFESLIHSDRISQLGAIEVGLRILQATPELRPALVRLIENIRDDDALGGESGFKMLSALFVLVDGELSRLRLFAHEPPFYRRLASLSHASLICRQIAELRVHADSFKDWAWSKGGQQYYMQSLSDMRQEPRWQPDLVAPAQMKADVLGRVMNAVRALDVGVLGADLRSLVFGDAPTSVQSIAGFPYPYLSGPLEGAEDVPNNLPSDLSQTIETQLRAEKASFVALVNSALIFRLGPDKANLAAEILQLGQHRLPNVKDTSQLLNILDGLATVAAVTRNRALADELRILVRRYQHDRKFSFAHAEALKICLVAAASCSELDEWTRFVGEWLTELAFRVSDIDEGRALLSHLMCLCHAVPYLWTSCGKADAALRALCGN